MSSNNPETLIIVAIVRVPVVPVVGARVVIVVSERPAAHNPTGLLPDGLTS